MSFLLYSWYVNYIYGFIFEELSIVLYLSLKIFRFIICFEGFCTPYVFYPRFYTIIFL